MTLALLTLALLTFTLSFAPTQNPEKAPVWALRLRLASGILFLLAVLSSFGCANNPVPSDGIFLTLTSDTPLHHITSIRITASTDGKTSLPTEIALQDASLPPPRSVLLHFPEKNNEIALAVEAQDAFQKPIAQGSAKSLPGRAIIIPLTSFTFVPLDAAMNPVDMNIPVLPDMTLIPPSCKNLDPLFCQSLPVPDGTFFRNYDGTPGYADKSFPAHMTSFRLDRYEVSVGRFRAFVEAGAGTQLLPPNPGSGTHPQIPGSGWDSAWNQELAPDTASLRTRLHCDVGHETWLDTPTTLESLPINCVSWYEAFAFCIWDGGRLPTEAEWNFAASGGDEQRVYPWGTDPVDSSKATYCTGLCIIYDIGSRSPFGDGRWGHADLSGNVWEWTLDKFGTLPNPCTDCANLDPTLGPQVIRGGGFSLPEEASLLRAQARGQTLPSHRDNSSGFRCARD